MQSNSKSPIYLANEAFKAGDFERAIKLYESALNNSDANLKRHIAFNLNLARRTLKQTLSGGEKFQVKSDSAQATSHLYVASLKREVPPPQKAARAIAFYLPQYHSIPENDNWWGKGFTDWNNVRSSTPQFEGHFQPHNPDDLLGYYDLKDQSVLAKQIEMAKQYGIEGFCFYYYWFSGSTLLEGPVEEFLNNSRLDLPFCLCWANENWTRRWDGLDSDILIEQHYSPEDDIKFIAHIAKYMLDKRYIRINGKPLLLVYRPSLFPDMRATADRWREWCRKENIGEIYLTYTQSFDCNNPAEFGFDAACEFPPNISKPLEITDSVTPLSKNFSSIVYDFDELVNRSDGYQDPGYTLFRGVAPSWDNTPRRKDKATVFANSTPELFEKWLTNAFVDSRKNKSDPDQQLVFINAWNEWAEGAHLEPDQRYGYAWLAAVRRSHEIALRQKHNSLEGDYLLIVDYALPFYDQYAGSKTNFMYLKVLLSMGFNIAYLPMDFCDIEPYSSELKRLGIKVLAGDWYKENWEKWLKENGQNISYAFLHKPDPASYFIDAIRKYTDSAIIYQCHDLHYLRLQRQAEITGNELLANEALFYFEKEKYLCSEADVVLTFSNTEEKIISEKFSGQNAHTVPLYIYEKLATPNADFDSRSNLICVGGFGHAPNADAVKWFCSDIFPIILSRLPNIVLNVVGANPPKEILNLTTKNIKFLGQVSEKDLEKLYGDTRLSIVPLRFGAGVKGKVMEALHFGIPLISTSNGLEGIEGINEIIQSKDDARAFANEVIELYENKGLWIERSAACTKFFNNRFTLSKVEKLLESIFKEAKSISRNKHQALINCDQSHISTIAFYLPQYHPIPENNDWWGEGFTEWRNVAKGKSLFEGHYQPQLPADLGFYDLRLEESRIAQADLARSFGITGFCYYHYWFNGRRLLERPAEEMLASGKPNFPFCLCWANENWTRKWDGKDSEVLIEQQYSFQDDKEHINDLFRFFLDARYIRVNGKPLFLVYRIQNLPNPRETAKIWRDEARKAGVGELFLVAVESIARINPMDIGFDASLEFAPDWSSMGSVASSYIPDGENTNSLVRLPEHVVGRNFIRNYREMMSEMLAKEQPNYSWLRSVTPSWDNSARRPNGDAVILVESSPKIYQEWLEQIILKAAASNKLGENFIFINAWNEWAEGNHLEPCVKWGKSYLEATAAAMKILPKMPNGAMTGGGFSQSMSVNKLHVVKYADDELTSHVDNLTERESTPNSLTISVDIFKSEDSLIYIKGWAVINDEECSLNSDIYILLKMANTQSLLIVTNKRIRSDITSHFNDGRNYDFSGFEGYLPKIELSHKFFIVIKRGNNLYWQEYTCNRNEINP